METSLENHLNCCRCCSNLLKTTQKTVKISKAIEKRFFELSGIKLIMSDNFSSVICESCNSKLSEFHDFRNEVCEYQMKLYEYAKGINESDKNEEHEEHIEEGNQTEDLLPMKQEVFEENPIVTYVPMAYDNPENYSTVDEKPFIESKVKKYCSSCNLYFPHKNYSQHRQRHHSEGFNFICDIDGKKFRVKNDLKEHMKIHENIDSRKRYYCAICQNPFLSMTALRNHENYFHSEYIEEHPCDQCGKIFPSRMKMQQHARTVHLGGSFMCSECHRTYATPASLKKHVIKAHSSKVPCSVCGKNFAKLSLKRHMKIHSAPEFQCTYENCGKKFHSKTSLNNHMESHQEGIPVQCPDCNATFPTSRHLFRHHKRQHTAMRAQCEVADCFHTATRKDYLVQHYKAHKELDETTRLMLIARVKDMKELGW